MIGFLLKAALLLAAGITACIGLIRAQPYDDSDLRTFLTPPDNCPAPCFLGIRPGVTSVQEAIAFLQAHEWIGEVTVYHNRVGQIYLIQWSWNGSQPALVDASKLAHIYARDNLVYTITMPTTVQFGDIWLSLGKPDRGGIGATGQHPASVFVQNIGYLSASIGVQTMILCPAKLKDMLQATVSMSFIGDMDARFGGDAYELSDWLTVQPCRSN